MQDRKLGHIEFQQVPHFLVSELISLIDNQLKLYSKSSKSHIRGVNAEQSLSAFYQYLCSDARELTAITKNHQLAMWLCTEAMDVYSSCLITSTLMFRFAQRKPISFIT